MSLVTLQPPGSFSSYIMHFIHWRS